jgi:CubicO group peptidase (beta-lactamase class C family)
LRGQSRPSDPASLAQLLEPLRTQHGLPALAGAIVEKGQLVAIGAVGERARGSGVPVTIEDRWHLGSCTKAMTATVAARLVERGTLRWELPIGEALAPWKPKLAEGWSGSTLELLLAHRGGAPASPPQPLWSELWARGDGSAKARRWFVGQLLAAPPESSPGTRYSYSNQGFTIAGAMLEAASGREWEALLRRELFGPLGMASAGFGPPGSAAEIDQPRGHAPGPIAPGPSADNPPAIGPAGTVHASLGDWAKFAAEHVRGARGESEYLKKDTWKRLHTPLPGQDYALGWIAAERSWGGGTVLTHSGSNTLWYCTIWLAPSIDSAFLAVTNCASEAAPKAVDAAIAAMLGARAK